MKHDPWNCDRNMRLNGYDYTTGQELSRESREWKGQMATALAEGGFRRVEHGETFVHSRSGAILFEVYGYLAKPGRRQQ